MALAVVAVMVIVLRIVQPMEEFVEVVLGWLWACSGGWFCFRNLSQCCLFVFRSYGRLLTYINRSGRRSFTLTDHFLDRPRTDRIGPSVRKSICGSSCSYPALPKGVYTAR